MSLQASFVVHSGQVDIVRTVIELHTATGSDSALSLPQKVPFLSLPHSAACRVTCAIVARR